MAIQNRPADKPAAEKPSAGFALFFSSVEGHLVPRYGAGSPAPYIGASSVADPRPGKPGGTKWDTSAIVPLTETEARIYRKEYADAVKDGALRVRTAEEFDAFVERDAQEAREAKDRAAADEPKKKAAPPGDA